MTKKNSPMKQIIKESLREMKTNPSGEFPNDPTLDDSEVSGPERFAKTQLKKDEIIVDRLLAPIATKEGYFLKLKKEVRIGEWMLMKVIKEEWRRWADMESSISDIVREHTRHMPQKWGTGNYRIEFACDGGMRGENYKDRDFLINAEEEFINNPAGAGVILPTQSQSVSDPSLAVAGQIETLSNLVGMLKGIFPTAPDPAKTQEQIASAFQQGMQLKVSGDNNSNNTTSALILGMMGMMKELMAGSRQPTEVNKSNDNDTFKGMLETLKTFGLVGQQPQEKQKTVIDFITELKALGMDLFEKKDPIAQLGQLKQLANIAGELMGLGGNGEKPGILEKIVDMVGPAIPGMIKDAKDAMGNAVAVQVEAGKNIERARITTTPASTTVPQGGGVSMNVGGNVGGNIASQGSDQITAFFNGLYEAVNQNNRMFYPVVYTSLLQDANGQGLIQGIVSGTHTAKEVIELLQIHGGDRYKDSEFVMKRLVGYTNGFIIWVRDMMKPKSYSGVEEAANETGHESIRQPGEPKPVGSTTYDAECPLCHTVYAFTNEQEYINEQNKSCEIEHNGVLCPGILQPMQRAS